MSACEILLIGILSIITPTFLQYYDTFPYSFIFVIFSKGLFFIAAYLLIFFFKKEKYHPQKDWHSLLLLFTPVATIFTLATLIKVGEYVTLPSSINILVSISAVLLLVSNIFAFGINQYNQKKNAQYTDMQLLLQKESDTATYYEMLLSQHENQHRKDKEEGSLSEHIKLNLIRSDSEKKNPEGQHRSSLKQQSGVKRMI